MFVIFSWSQIVCLITPRDKHEALRVYKQSPESAKSFQSVSILSLLFGWKAVEASCSLSSPFFHRRVTDSTVLLLSTSYLRCGLLYWFYYVATLRAAATISTVLLLLYLCCCYYISLLGCRKACYCMVLLCFYCYQLSHVYMDWCYYAATMVLLNLLFQACD